MPEKIAIIDFNRTIFNPDNNQLMPEALVLLQYLQNKKIILYLLSNATLENTNERMGLINSLGIKNFFQGIFIKDGKSLEDFKSIISFHKNLDPKFSWVIGDRIRREIILANQCGFKTIWFKNGKFSNEIPDSAAEQPDFIVENLSEILEFIK